MSKQFNVSYSGFLPTVRTRGPGRKDRLEHRVSSSLDIFDGEYFRPPVSSVSTYKCPSQFKQKNIGLRNVFQNEDDCPLMVSSIDGISTQFRASSMENLFCPSYQHLPPELPIFLIKSKAAHTEIKSIRRKIKTVSTKCFRNIQRKKRDSNRNVLEENLPTNFDFKNVKSKLREKSGTERSLSEHDSTVCQTEAQIENHQR